MQNPLESFAAAAKITVTPDAMHKAETNRLIKYFGGLIDGIKWSMEHFERASLAIITIDLPNGTALSPSAVTFHERGEVGRQEFFRLITVVDDNQGRIGLYSADQFNNYDSKKPVVTMPFYQTALPDEDVNQLYALIGEKVAPYLRGETTATPQAPAYRR